MKIKLVTEEKINGVADRRSEELSAEVIVVGRGAGCQIRLHGKLISLEHARFKEVSGELFLEILSSLSPVTLNRKPISGRASLRPGHEIGIGDYTLKIGIENGIWTLTLEQEPPSEAPISSEQVMKRLSLTRRLPGPRWFVLVAALIAIAGLVLYPLLTNDHRMISSGIISNNHAMLAQRCGECHNSPFVPVSDETCESCHQLTKHSKFLGDHPEVQGACRSCHFEHSEGKHLIVSDSRMCVECHAAPTKIDSQSATQNVASFDTHPQFRVRVQALLPDLPDTRVSLDDAAALKDNSFVRLNHFVHLNGAIRSRTGLKQLGCRDCHLASADQRTIEPISFEKNCQSCHPLDFDERLPGVEVPHGDPNIVFRFLYSEYAKLALAEKIDRQTAEVFQLRGRPGGGIAQTAQAEAAQPNAATREFVERESRAAEDTLFKKTACKLCHRVVDSETPPEQITKDQSSRYAIIKPRIPVTWFPSARFNHNSHEEMTCESCHGKVRESKLTNDVLLPKVAKCQECHSDVSHNQTVSSPCIQCHSFHDKKLVEDTLKRATLFKP